jgi:hypothetical protein
MSLGDTKEAYEGYKKWKYIGYSKEPVIYVPPWNDIIHLVDEKQLSEEEQRRRAYERMQRLQRSPSPEVAKNIGTIMTAIDDIQDFCTTSGVFARLMERATKLPHILSEGAFTAGEALNSINMFNKIPWEKLSVSEIRDMVRKKKIDLDKLTEGELRALEHELRERYPDWENLTPEAKKEYMQAHYKMTRERWGMSLKDKKRQAEELYGKGTPWGKLTTQVNKRLARTLPTHGEMLEMAQTSDNMAGIGLSLGPLVGLLEDLIFGAIKGAPLKFSDQTITPEELDVIKQLGYDLLNLPMETLNSLEYLGNILTKTTYMIAAGEDLGIDDFLTALWANAQAYIESRRKELSYAISNLTETVKNWLFHSGQRTSKLIKEALITQGINPSAPEGFPGVSIPPRATIREISEAYLTVCTSNIKKAEEKLSKDERGQFLASCISTIAHDTACFYCAEDGVIHETFSPELVVYTRAVDYGLEPPIWATNEEFSAWHQYIMDNIMYWNTGGPTYELLYHARARFWPLEFIMPPFFKAPKATW